MEIGMDGFLDKTTHAEALLATDFPSMVQKRSHRCCALRPRVPGDAPINDTKAQGALEDILHGPTI